MWIDPEIGTCLREPATRPQAGRSARAPAGSPPVDAVDEVSKLGCTQTEHLGGLCHADAIVLELLQVLEVVTHRLNLLNDPVTIRRNRPGFGRRGLPPAR